MGARWRGAPMRQRARERRRGPRLDEERLHGVAALPGGLLAQHGPRAANALHRGDDDGAELRRGSAVEGPPGADAVELAEELEREEVHEGVAEVRLPRRVARGVDGVVLPLEAQRVQGVLDALLRTLVVNVLDHRGAGALTGALAEVQAGVRLVVGAAVARGPRARLVVLEHRRGAPGERLRLGGRGRQDELGAKACHGDGFG
mmetsp:Transcript_38232/g.108527  ORF Transcript_38232/g.108527 Transcript_38232/m.108527 type:complete len:203 (-) Transcript_38232:27-635(-)